MAHAQVPDYVPTEGLVAWYPFNGNANDESGYANNGVVFGASLTFDRFGIASSAYNFDGNDHIEAQHQDWLNMGTGSTTWTGWGKKTSGNDHAHFLTKIEATSSPYSATGKYLRYGPNENIEFAEGQSGNGGNSVNVHTSELLNEWVHLVGVKDSISGTMRIYQNGILMGESAIQNEQSFDQSGSLFIGCEHPYISLPSGPQYFFGDLDDLGIWNRALTEEEILALYNAEPPIPGCTDSTACNFDAEATSDDGSCIPSGCMEPLACNYNALAECEGEACDYTCCPGPGCCAGGTSWDYDLGQCVPDETNDATANSCPQDLDFDGVIGVGDLMDLLSVFGTDCPTNFTCGDPINYHGYDYATVQIGEQCWFAENLRSENYENGDSIPTNLTDSEWENASTGAVATFGEGESSCFESSIDGDACEEEWSLNEYGRLYNWFAVDDPRGLCPNGWHVPSNEEWTTMTDDLGGASEVGGELRSSYGWPENGNGSNLSGFSGLPGGYRYWSGSFSDAGNFGSWWSSTPAGSSAWFRYLLPASTQVYGPAWDKRYGYSVRCLKDQ